MPEYCCIPYIVSYYAHSYSKLSSFVTTIYRKLGVDMLVVPMHYCLSKK